MPSLIPMKFNLDAAGEISRALENDATATILSARVAFNGSKIYKAVNDAADLLLPDTQNEPDTCTRQAFTGSALVVAAAFHEADAEDGVREKALKALSVYGAPRNLLGNSPAQTLTAFQLAAIMAHKRHPEFSEATDKILKFHTAVTPGCLARRYALCGTGFMIGQLDKAWAQVREAGIQTAYQAEINTIQPNDWDTFFE